jgi:hypothetical protein
LSLELLNWRLYKDVLNFEEEGHEMLLNIHNLIEKTKLLKKNNDDMTVSHLN